MQLIDKEQFYRVVSTSQGGEFSLKGSLAGGVKRKQFGQGKVWEQRKLSIDDDCP